MEQEHSELFRIRLNQDGEKYIRRFAAMSYTMLVLLFFVSAIGIFWDIKFLVNYRSVDLAGYRTTLYDKVFPYLSIALNVLVFIFNIYYLNFPRILLRSIKAHDEYGANKAFKTLLRGAIMYMIWLFLDAFVVMWSLVNR